MKLPFTSQHLFLKGICSGAIHYEDHKRSDFGSDEALVFDAASQLRKAGNTGQLDEVVLGEYIKHVLGKDPVPLGVSQVFQRIRDCQLEGDAEGLRQSILKRRATTTALQELTHQLSQDTYDVSKVVEILSVVERPATPALIPLSQYLDAEESETWEALHCVSLPQLMHLTGGIRGVWVMAGAPGAGKSTLIMQMALDLGFYNTHVYWVNFELDPPAIQTRAKQGWPGEPEHLAEFARERVSFIPPTHVNKIEDYVKQHQDTYPDKRALFVIDTFQKLPVHSQNARLDYNRWLHRFEKINLDTGYPFLIASQKDRGHYEDAILGAFKETSELESTMTVGIQLLPMKDIFGALELYIVKNRHAKATGHVLNLYRERNWWFVEAEA